jgi:transposase-like protein
MGRRHKLDRYPEAKREALRMYFEEGKSLRDIEREISIKYPVEVSKSSIQRLVKRYEKLAQLQELGILTKEDVDLLAGSQSLAKLSELILLELIVEWKENGEIPKEKLDAVLDLVATTSRVAKSQAEIERVKTQLAQFWEKRITSLGEKLKAVIPDEETFNRVLEVIKDDLLSS